MNGSGLVCRKRHPLGYQATSQLYCSLTRHGVIVWRTFRSPLLVETEMDPSISNPKEKESSASRASGTGTSSEAPIGATEQDLMEQGTGGTPLIEEERLHNVEGMVEGIRLEAPAGVTERNQVEQGMGATPLIGEEQPPPCGHTMESLEGPTAKVGTLGLQVRKRVVVALPESWRGSPSLRWLLRGNRGWPTSVCRRRTTTGLSGTRQVVGSARAGACGSIAEVPAEWGALACAG
jgi:hypothetical protein